MTNATLRGNPDAGNPHVRFDEGEVASEKPRRGSLLYKFHLLVTVVSAACVAQAAELDKSFLPDYNMEHPVETWGLSAEPEKGRIESFRGLWTPLDYVRVPAGTKFSREVTLETNACYVLTWTQRGVFSGGVSPAGRVSKPGKYGVNPIDRGFDEKSEWVDREYAFWTHTNAQFRVGLRETQGRTGEIGRIALRKMDDMQVRDFAMEDPGFEKSVVGKAPSWGHPLWGCFDAKVVDTGAHGGKKCAKLTLNTCGAYALPGGVARKGDKFEASVWVWLPRPAKIGIALHTREPGGNMHKELSRHAPAGWNQLKAGGVANNRHSSFGGSDTPYVTYDGDISVTSTDGKGMEVLIDDWAFRREAADSVGDTEHPRIANGSFRCGPWGWRIWNWTMSTNFVGRNCSVSLCTTDSSDGDGRCLAIRTGLPLNMDSPPWRVRFGGTYEIAFSAKSDKPICLQSNVTPGGGGTFDLSNVWRRCTMSVVAKPHPHMTGGDWMQVGFSAPADDATLFLDDFQVSLKGAAPETTPLYETGLWFDGPFAIWNVGEPARTLHLAATAVRGDGRNLSAVLTIADKDGKVFSRQTLGKVEFSPLQRGKDTASTEWEVVPKQDVPGYYHAKLALVDAAGKTVAWNETTYSVLPQPRDLTFRESGAGILFGADWVSRWGGQGTIVKGRNGANVGEQLDVLKKMGIKWIRVMGPGSWRTHEMKPGKYDWLWHDYLREIKRHGMGTFVEFDCHDHPQWSKGQPAKGLYHGKIDYAPKVEDLEAFAERYAREYKGEIDAVNFVNEVGSHPVGIYLELIGGLYRGIKKVSPEVIVQGPGMPADLFPNIHTNSWMARAYAKNYAAVTDVHGIHPYEAGQWQQIDSLRSDPVETHIWRKNLGKTEEQMVRDGIADLHVRCPGRPVWDSESGYNFNTVAPWQYTPNEPRQIWYTERVAAARLARWGILCRAAGVEKWIYFSFIIHMFYHGLDICNFDGTPKAGVSALATFWSVLDGSKPVKSETLADGTRLETFRDADGKRVMIFWNPLLENEPAKEFVIPDDWYGENRSQAATGKMPVAPFRAISVEGAPVAVTEKGGRRTLPLSDEPVYVVLMRRP